MSPVIWQNLLNGDVQSTSLLESYSLDFDASKLSLTIGATVQYVGRSADGNFDDAFNLGTTYWLDFESFSNVDGGISSPGTCANRQAADYANLQFDEMWEYPVNPLTLDAVNTAERMAYPPSDWTLTATECTVIEFERTFSWTELSSCADADGNALIEISESDDTVDLTGTFYVELVSPYSMSSTDYYRTFPLLQQDFGIALSRTVNVLASTGVQLFIPSVMAYGRDADGKYQVTVLIQSADYVQLGMDDVAAIDSPDPLAVSQIDGVSGTECLVASSFTCGQIFTATIPAECPDEDSSVDLSGNYQFSFTPECREIDGSPDAACTVFLSTLDDSSGKVVMDLDASFVDQCDVNLFEVAFDGDLTFYSDDAFSAEADGSDPFVIGQDTVYGKVTVNIPADPSGETYQFVDVELENVYVCTAADTADLSVDPSTGIGGCLSAEIDADGPYTVIGSAAVADYEGSTDFESTASNEAMFSFLTFDTARETINVHVQLLMTMATPSGRRRRSRMLLQSDGEGNAFRSYIATAAVQDGPTTDDPEGKEDAAPCSGGLMAAMFGVVVVYAMG
jgi:hypothetical protein